jgi:type II secretory pathway pseudopilin PulG
MSTTLSEFRSAAPSMRGKLADSFRQPSLPRKLAALAAALWLAAFTVVPSASAQTLINVDFGVGQASGKSGFAGTGLATNDHWNLYSHYAPRFVPGTELKPHGWLAGLKLSDGAETGVALAVTNAPGVWGNASGDKMFDTYLFAMNGGNVTVTITGLTPGRYHFHCYGHAHPDVTGEQNSVFTVHSGTNTFGPLTAVGAAGWKATLPWRENQQFVVFRDVPVEAGRPVTLEVAPGPNGVAVINGLQIISRGTAPPKVHAPVATAQPPAFTNLVFREIRYTGRLADTEARFQAVVNVESLHTNEISGVLFEGDVAVIAPQLPEGVRLVSQGRQVRLFLAQAGRHALNLELVAKITREEPWNRTAFAGPPAAIATVQAQATGRDADVQLLSGVHDFGAAADKPATGRVQGFLGADRMLSLRWQSKAAEVARKSLITADTTVTAKITPTVVNYCTQIRFEILQAPVPQLHLALPAGHTLTKLDGPQIRDWRVAQASSLSLQASLPPDQQVLVIDFIKPVEKSYQLTLYTEQPVESTPVTLPITAPQPLEVTRESGAFTVSADEMLVEFASLDGLRQVNAPDGALGAFRFHGRPASLNAAVRRIEPVIFAADRVTARLEESRLVVTHQLNLTVEKAGIYTAELTPQTGFTVSDVRGEGVDDWKVADGRLRVSFNARVLGARALTVQLEPPQRDVPPQFTVAALRVAGAERETAQIGAASVQGIRLKTFDPDGLREVPITSLPNRSDEVLAYTDLRADWSLTLAAERLEPRIVAEVFNVVTIGDGLVGGSAVVRYGIINQGVQDFRVSLPAHWKNVEFTGPNIRRKELIVPSPDATTDTNSVVWAIALQDKAWGGYTLVITYDYQFDPQGAALDLRGAHPLGVERETGSLAVTTAAGLKLEPQAAALPLRVIDPTELSDNDRTLVTRPILLAYRYTGTDFAHHVAVKRHAQVDLLDAVADRTQLTTVLTEAGEMLTQAGFMVKNNDRQYQRFELPAGADLWACYVNGEPVKAEKDGRWTLVSLPRTANRDQAFAVDLIYAQKIGPLDGLWPKQVALAAPKTDVPNTYAEWEVFVPQNRRLLNFGGSMTVARGTRYGVQEAWSEFTAFYERLWREMGVGLVMLGSIVLVCVAMISQARRRGVAGLIRVCAVVAVIGLLAAMAIPNFVRVRTTGQKNSVISTMRQLEGALQQHILESKKTADYAPASLDELKPYLKGGVLPTDPTGRPFTYLGASGGQVLLYSDIVDGQRGVMLRNGNIELMNEAQFQAALAGQQVAGQLDQPATASQLNPMLAAANPGFNNPAVASQPGLPSPTVAGLRSIRIDLPVSGSRFSFTKVLNTGVEPLSVEVSMMKQKTFQAARMVLQLAAFLAGLFLMWREWQRVPASSFRFALGACFALGAVGSLFIAGRVLHWVFIAAVPVALLAALIWIARRLWQSAEAPAESSVATSSHIPPAAVAILGLLILQLGTAPAEAASAKSAIRIPHSAITNVVSLLSATYTGTVTGQVAQFDATLRLSNIGTNVTIPLFSGDVALTEFTAQGGEVRLLREDKTVSILLARPADVTLQLKLAARLGGDVTKRQLAFAIPPALASRLTVVLDEEDADVEFPSAVSLQRTLSGSQTRVEAVLGPAGDIDLQWTPRMKRATEVAATVFARNHALVTVAGGVINTRATLDYQIMQGELRRLRVRVPAGHRLLRVEGEGIRTWELGAPGSSPAGSSDILQVDLLKPATRTYQLTIEIEKPLAALPVTAPVELPHTLEVQRETGLVALRGGEEVLLAIDRSEGLQRVDAAEFARATKEKADGLHSAWRFLRTGFDLAARAEAVRPEVEAVVHNHLRVGFEQLNLNAQIDYTVRQAGIFGVKLALPANFRVLTVNATGGVAQTRAGQKAEGGAAIQMWVEKQEDNRRLLEVTFKERTLGSFQVRVALEQITMQLPPTLGVAGVQPLETEKLSGFVVVTSEGGVAVKSGAFDGLIEVPASTLPRRVSAEGGSVLAFKFVGTAGADAQPWSLVVNTEGMESWLRAEIVSVLAAGETLLSGRAQVRYEIQNAPVKEFRLRVPAAYRNVEVSGQNIRRRDREGEEWKIELQNKVRGTVLLTVTWEEPKDARTNAVAVAGLEALGVERETGAVVILAKAPLQVTEKAATGELSRIDVRELPAWAGGGQGMESAALTYRYLRPGWQLMLDARRFDDATLLQALVESATLTTVVADDGQMMSEMALQIRNNGRQFLEITLPTGAELWSAFVAGQPVRPTRQGDLLLLPLEQVAGADGAIAVEVTFVHEEKFPRTKGRVDFASPRLGVPLKNARWELWLPPDYEYASFAGSMAHEAGAAPVSRTWSALEYSLKETARVASRSREAEVAVSNVRSNLKAGNNYEAAEFLKQARQNSMLADESVNRELQQLETDFNRSQGGKLIEAQQAYSLENSTRFGAQLPAAVQQQQAASANPVDYDADIATRQWAMLCKAQELSSSRIQTLRVNLPTRGQRHSFTQVLQTEVNKPMTVEFLARSTRTTGWPRALALTAGGFLIVWLLAATALARRKEEALP